MIDIPHVRDGSKVKRWDYPLRASPKVNGFRCFIDPELGPTLAGGGPVPNRFIRDRLSDPRLRGLDGELVVGPHLDVVSPTATQSAVTRADGQPEFRFFVFDDATRSAAPFRDRLAGLRAKASDLPEFATVLEQPGVCDARDLRAVLRRHSAEGWEGTVLRDFSAPRGEGTWKLKPRADAEFRVVGINTDAGGFPVSLRLATRTGRSFSLAGLSNEVLLRLHRDPASVVGAPATVGFTRLDPVDGRPIEARFLRFRDVRDLAA